MNRKQKRTPQIKNNNSTKNITLENPEELSPEQVWQVLDFAKSYASGLMGTGLYSTPDILNARLKDVSFNPIGGSETELNDALNNPKNSEQTLRQFVEFLEIASMPFRRIMAYQHSQLAFDLTWTVNANIKDYSKSSFKKEQEKVFDYLDNFDYKKYFRIALKQMLRNEVFVCSPRQQATKIVLQELPLDRCKITGRWDYGLLIDFDFTYFLQPGVSTELYHPWFTEKFIELSEGKLKSKYNPNVPVSERGDSQFGLWIQVPPHVAFVFKFDDSIVTSVPYYSSLLPEFYHQNTVRGLQKNQYLISAAKILFGAVPLLKDQKTSLKDALAISPEVAGKFLALVKSALGESIKVATAPMEDVDLFSVESDNEQYQSYLQTAVSSSGVNTPLVFSGTQKANALESQLSWFSDYLIMEKVYPQFNNFMNYFIGKQTSNYKWSFEFEGSDYFLDRDKRLKTALDFADRGIVLPQKMAAAIGMPLHRMLRMMDESDSIGFVDRLKPIQMASQMSAEAQKNGRPQKNTSELSDSGIETRDAGSNIEKGGNI